MTNLLAFTSGLQYTVTVLHSINNLPIISQSTYVYQALHSRFVGKQSSVCHQLWQLLNYLVFICSVKSVPSVLWRCWLGSRKGIRPVKTEWWSTGVVICRERGAGFHIAQMMTLPLTVSCSSKIQIGFTFLLPAHPGCPGKEAVKWL